MAAEDLPIILLMGPTASGKTDLAVELSRRLPLEIISVDSAMVYRGMDIGTAKPTADLLAQAPHRLIDICDPADPYSAGRFRRDALAAIAEITARERLPLLVGGTMLYFRTLLHGLADLPQADAALRARLDQRAARRGWPALHADLARLDPDAAARIHPNDAQRIQRALEVHYATGRPISELQRDVSAGPQRRSIRIALEPADRSRLAARIEARFERMMALGFVAEVEILRARVDLNRQTPALRAVGYRQLWDYLDRRIDLDEAQRRAIAATRQLAKRQLTWLRSEPGGLRLDALDRDRIGPILAHIEAALARGGLC